MATGRSLPNPPDEYEKVEEKAFRGNLQLSPDELSSKIASLERSAEVERARTMQMVSPSGVPSGVPGLSDGDLDFEGDSGTGSVVLDSESLDIAGGAGITTTASGQTLTAALSPSASDGNFIVGSGSDFVAESGDTARTSLGVGTGDSPQFTGVNVGHASDTTVTRASAGNLNVEGNLVYRAGGTDVPVADGGTGASTASAARTNLGCGTGDGTVDTSGTPVDNDYAKFTDANTIEGRSYSEVRGDLYPESYLTASRSFTTATATRYFSSFTSGEKWYTDSDCDITLDTWVKNQQDGTPEWDDSSVDGEFIYKGTATRKFLITWNLNMWYYLRNNYTALMGGIFLKPDGGAWSSTTPVAGSSQVSRLYFDYTFSIYWSYSTSLSGGAIVTVEPDDTIRFQFGWKMYSGTNTGGLIVSYASGGTNVDGMTLNIVPVT